jgi:hypothetical protein
MNSWMFSISSLSLLVSWRGGNNGLKNLLIIIERLALDLFHRRTSILIIFVIQMHSEPSMLTLDFLGLHLEIDRHKLQADHKNREKLNPSEISSALKK